MLLIVIKTENVLKWLFYLYIFFTALFHYISYMFICVSVTTQVMSDPYLMVLSV